MLICAYAKIAKIDNYIPVCKTSLRNFEVGEHITSEQISFKWRATTTSLILVLLK